MIRLLSKSLTQENNDLLNASSGSILAEVMEGHEHASASKEKPKSNIVGICQEGMVSGVSVDRPGCMRGGLGSFGDVGPVIPNISCFQVHAFGNI